jgi:hypothetical protein
MSIAPVALCAMLLAGCSVPLAPGYELEKQTLDVHFVAGSPPHLAIRAGYQLRNVGNSELTSIDATLPLEKTFARQDLRVQIDGRSVVAAPVPNLASDETPGDDFRIPFDPPWPEKKRLSLVIEYDLAPALPGRASIAVNENSFHIHQGGWIPVLQTPRKLFAHDVERPDPAPINFLVPAGFAVLSGGDPAGSKKRGGEVEYRFRLQKWDLDPYVVAGRYQQQTVNLPGPGVIFWTLEPLSPAMAQASGGRLSAAMTTYEKAFGTIARSAQPIWLVETPALLRSFSSAEDEPAARPFPGGVLLNRAAFAAGVASESFLALADHELAHTWLGEEIILRPEARLGMGEGFAEYATVVLAEARGGPAARREAVERFLRAYDDERTKAADKPLRALTARDPWEQRRLAFTKGALFFVALEDQYGEDGVRKSLAYLFRTMRGESAGYAELRSALEQQTGQNLGGFFRAWLDGKGIPEDFRKRYEDN